MSHNAGLPGSAFLRNNNPYLPPHVEIRFMNTNFVFEYEIFLRYKHNFVI